MHPGFIYFDTIYIEPIEKTYLVVSNQHSQDVGFVKL